MTHRDKKRICIAAFAGAHGVRGDVKIMTFTEKPEDLTAYGPLAAEDGERTFQFKILKTLKPGLLLARSREIKTREEAQALKGVKLYVDRDKLPATETDEFYYEDLAGLAAVDEKGAPAGNVTGIYNFGAGDLLELSGVPGRKGAVLIPFAKSSVLAVDLEAGKITLSADALEMINASGREK